MGTSARVGLVMFLAACGGLPPSADGGAEVPFGGQSSQPPPASQTPPTSQPTPDAGRPLAPTRGGSCFITGSYGPYCEEWVGSDFASQSLSAVCHNGGGSYSTQGCLAGATCELNRGQSDELRYTVQSNLGTWASYCSTMGGDWTLR